MNKIRLQFAVVSYFFYFFLRFGWALLIGGLFCIFASDNRLLMATGMGLVLFDFIASFIESVRVFLKMGQKNHPSMYGFDMDEQIEKNNEELFEIPEALSGKICIQKLKEQLSDESTVEECVRAFEKICEDPIDDDMLLFECGIYPWEGDYFSFSLTRQYPDGADEFFQVKMELIFTADKENKKLFESAWDSRIKGDFFDYVRNSKSYRYAQENKSLKLRIYMEQT